ncbi:PH domain-containing protein [Bifidobacterium crudilactis]|uniref:PH domain-containing protein n=1 Tax=Bifidobacterium crudilactis TaxID=327277 RepID=UPI00235755D3|nr:PH domain-containing protein [Bifidobacterium crudilactis]
MTAPTMQFAHSEQSGQGNPADGNSREHQSQGQWRLLHPLVLVEDAISGVKSSVSLIIAAGVVLFRFDLPSWAIWAVGVAIVVCACVIAPLLGYFSTRYRLTGESVEYHTGILVRKRNIIAYSHIHAVSSDEPFYYKPFSVVKLTVASAGNVAADMVLKAVPSDVQYELERLRSIPGSSGPGLATVQGRPAGEGASAVDIAAHEGAGTVEPAGEQGTRLYRASTSDILLYALTDLRFLAAVLALLGLLDRVRDLLSDRLFDEAASKVTGFLSGGALVVIVLGLLLVLALVLASVVNSMMRFYGFEVWRRQDDLVIERGLLTRRKVTIPMDRIQSVGIHQSVMRRILHLSSVTLSLSASHGEDDDGDNTSINLLPVIKQRAVIAALAGILPQWDIPEAEVERTGRGLMRFLLVVPVSCTVIGTLAASAVAIVTRERMMLLWMLLPLAAGLLWCFFRWMKGRNEGFQLLDEQRIIVSGARGFALFWVVTRRSRIQSVERRTTVLRQRRGVEGMTMPLFVFAGESELRFSAIREDRAAQLQEWAMRIPD